MVESYRPYRNGLSLKQAVLLGNKTGLCKCFTVDSMRLFCCNDGRGESKGHRAPQRPWRRQPFRARLSLVSPFGPYMYAGS